MASLLLGVRTMGCEPEHAPYQFYQPVHIVGHWLHPRLAPGVHWNQAKIANLQLSLLNIGKHRRGEYREKPVAHCRCLGNRVV